MNPLMKFTLAGIAMATLGTGFVIGCGGGSGGPGAASTVAPQPEGNLSGRVEITIDWPPEPEGNAPRLIPAAARSIKLEIKRGNQTLPGAIKIVNRPATGALFEKLPVAPLTVVATAYPQDNAIGTPQALGTAPLQTVVDAITRATVTMRSTITRLRVVAANSNLVVGEFTTLTVTPLDAAGRIVLVETDNPTAIHYIQPTGVRVGPLPEDRNNATRSRATAMSSGTWTITAREPESRATGRVTINVSCPLNMRRADGSCAEPTPVPTPTGRPTPTPSPVPTPTPAGFCPGGYAPDPEFTNGPGCNGCDVLGSQCPPPPQYPDSEPWLWRYNCRTGECEFLGPK